MHTLVECFQCLLTAYGVAEEHGEKIDDFVVPEAATCKAYLFSNLREQVSASKKLSDDHHLSKPARC